MGNLSRDLYELARNIGPQLISLFTLLTCIVIVLARWKRHPKVSLIAAIGLVLMILHALFFAVADVWLIPLLIDEAPVDIDRFYMLFGLFTSVTLAIAYVVLLLAIFIDREPMAPASIES
jgi:hypothetical protein